MSLNKILAVSATVLTLAGTGAVFSNVNSNVVASAKAKHHRNKKSSHKRSKKDYFSAGLPTALTNNFGWLGEPNSYKGNTVRDTLVQLDKDHYQLALNSYDSSNNPISSQAVSGMVFKYSKKFGKNTYLLGSGRYFGGNNVVEVTINGNSMQFSTLYVGGTKAHSNAEIMTGYASEDDYQNASGVQVN